MASLQDLLARRAALDQEIDDTRRTARADAIAKVRALMSENGLTVADISGRAGKPAGGKGGGKGSKVAVKYREPGTDNSWTGRGLQPKWLKAAIASGKSVQDFAVGA